MSLSGVAHQDLGVDLHAPAQAARRGRRFDRGAAWGAAKRVIVCSVVPLGLLTAWALVVQCGVVSRHVLVSPLDVAAGFGRVWSSGELYRHLSRSLARLTLGVGIGTSLGLAAGIAMGISPAVERSLGPAFHTARQIPSIALIPALILILGVEEPLKIVVVAKSSFFPVALATLHGVKQIPQGYLEVAAVHRLPRAALLRRLVVPATAPPIVAGIRIALGRSWLVLVACELMAADSGVGQMMEMARQMFRMDVVMVGVFVTGGIGLLLDSSVRLLERLIVRGRGA